jgi:2-polyprenyl-6-methoxyphenol hydroxylase-like FAD-dependent oxidoreductase
MGSGRVYWWLSVNRPVDSPAGVRGELAEALAECKYWEGPAAEMVAATPEETILRHEVFDRPPIREWSRGRVALLGDAAHPMTPNLGQGANQALEDAMVLSNMLREVESAEDIETALRGYQGERVRRANRMVRQSRMFGRIGQVSWGPAVWARNTTARITPSFVGRWWYGSLSRPRVR